MQSCRLLSSQALHVLDYKLNQHTIFLLLIPCNKWRRHYIIVIKTYDHVITDLFIADKNESDEAEKKYIIIIFMHFFASVHTTVYIKINFICVEII